MSMRTRSFCVVALGLFFLACCPPAEFATQGQCHNAMDGSPLAPRPWPDTTSGIHVFNDQLSSLNSLSEAQIQFAVRHYVGTQKMTRADADRLRAINPSFLILHYRLGLGLGYREVHGECQPSGDYLHIIEDDWVQEWPGEAAVQPAWFFSWAGQPRVYMCDWGWYLMNLDDASYRAWWIGEVKRQLAANDDDGLFADSLSVPNYLGGGSYSPALPNYNPAFEAAWSLRIHDWITFVKSQLGQYKLIPNVGSWVTTRDATDYSGVDGVMIEGFGEWGAGDPYELADWQLQMNRILGLTRGDKIVIAQAYTDGSVADRLFLLASYLLIKGAHSYVNLDIGMEPEWWPEYEIPVGSYEGSIPANVSDLYYGPWSVYRRSYHNALVLVNPGTTARAISLGQTYYRANPVGGGMVPEGGVPLGWRVDYAPVNQLTLAPHQGAILLKNLSAVTTTPSPTQTITPTPTRSATPTAAGTATATSTPSLVGSATWYVRTDGGSPSQCTGRVNAPYPGSGQAQPCAWDHLFRALPPGGESRIAGGDTLTIAAGSYRMGYGAPGTELCSRDYPWDCTMPPIPSGPDAQHPTRLLGADCAHPPELWGTEGTYQITNLTGSSNIEIGCLEITDHSSCVEFHTGGLACQRDEYPFGDWAARGIYAEDSTHAYLHDLNIHGLAATGIQAGRLADWTVERVRLAGNGWVGWDGDIDGEDSNMGTLRFSHWTVEWNGCGETWPGGQPIGCWAQTAGGYGDGVGTGETGGYWIIEDSAFLHNTSDGLDLLYVRVPGSQIEIRRTRAEGNAGNQIKTTGPTLIENSVIVGNCGFFAGQPFTYNVDDCRAAGNALSFDLRPGDQVTVTNCTVTSEGDCLLVAGCDGACVGAERVRLRNNILIGQDDATQEGDRSCLAWAEGFAHDPIDLDYTLIHGAKGAPPCPGAHDLCEVEPRLVSSILDAFDAHLLPDSPAINRGDPNSAPGDDFTGNPRDAQPDIGAYERRSEQGWREFLPRASR